MKQTICDGCRQKMGETNHKKHVMVINKGTVEFNINTKEEDLCYYCACEKAYEAALRWKKEADQPVEGQRRMKKRELTI